MGMMIHPPPYLDMLIKCLIKVFLIGLFPDGGAYFVHLAHYALLPG
jgi:hypothetical protein